MSSTSESEKRQIVGDAEEELDDWYDSRHMS